MPRDKLNAFIKSFGMLKQKVLWKYEDESITDLPPNVKISKWLPQSDILAHKNIVLFITHGGVFGKQEGLYHGVPMLMIPFYGDQVNIPRLQYINLNLLDLSFCFFSFF